MQMPLWSKQGKPLVCVFAIALAVAQLSSVPAQGQARPSLRSGVQSQNAQPQTNNSPNMQNPLSLWGTFVYTNANLSATCDSEGCSQFTQAFNEQIVCPTYEGGSCTFQITIGSENAVYSNDDPPINGESGQYRFSVDGAAPSPGPAGTAGYECSNCSEFYFSANYNEDYIASSVSVAAVVKNTGSKKHTVEVDIGCVEDNLNATGCTVLATGMSLRVEVYTSRGILF